MKARGETMFYSAEGASVAANLSGKRTLVGRHSGERRIMRTPKGKAFIVLYLL